MATDKPARLPVSTYRLQFHGGFTFRNAEVLVPYLAWLGVTECYCSPLLAARPGSAHGYDICDHSRLNPELGTEEDFRAFTRALKEHRIGLLLDFVPNHMGIDSSANLWWRDVLENGPSAASARFFDIDWDPVKPELKGKVLLPILGDQYGVELEGGHLQVRFHEGVFSLQYYDHDLPLNPRQVRKLLRHNLHALEADLDPEDPHLREFLSILFQLEHMPPYTETDPVRVEERRREIFVAQERLAHLIVSTPRIRQHIEDNVQRFNGRHGVPASFHLLHDLLDAQPYRLSYWRTALHEINYRRFFDINELAGLRMEDPEVFEATHKLILSLIREGAITGLRLDHVDGLFDPAGYFRRLLDTCCEETAPPYIIAEKILSTGEPLRDDWTIHGTTGYDYLNDLNGLFIDSRNAQKFRRLYARFVGRQDLFADVVYESKKLIIMTSMASELNVLAHALNRISESNWRFRDFTLDSLQDALREVVACFPYYRTYFNEDGWSESDEKTIDTAVARALRRNPAVEPSIFAFIRSMLLPAKTADATDEEYERRVQFAMKFQQYTGPVQAKGLEDTAFYRYGPLLPLNEVGGDPFRFGRSPDEFHHVNRERLAQWPFSMLATATHDTKRGEDARARLNVLSEMPDDFRVELTQWARVNAAMRTTVDGKPAPDRRDEYLFYQALLGAWPPDCTDEPDAEFVERMRAYMLKAIKEEKIHTSWIHPSEVYDEAVSNFVRRTLTGPRFRRFLRLFSGFQQRIAKLGMVNSLGQVALKIASPGVPDFYQGSELWDFNLVDPDNRRPVNFDLRRKLLQGIEALLKGTASEARTATSIAEMLANWKDGRIKLFLTATGLRLRRSRPALFLQGDYIPLYADGARKDHVVAFARRHNRQILIVAVPRLVAALTPRNRLLPVGKETWRETSLILPTELGKHDYRNALTRAKIALSASAESARLPMSEVLSACPVAFLLADSEESV